MFRCRRKSVKYHFQVISISLCYLTVHHIFILTKKKMHVDIFWRYASWPIKGSASVAFMYLLLVSFNRAQVKTRMSHLIRVYAVGAHLVTKSSRLVFSIAKRHFKPSTVISHSFSYRLLKKKQMTRESGSGKQIILTPAKVGCVHSCSISVHTG